MPLRTPNNPIPAKVLLGAVRAVIPANTALTLVNANDPTGLSQVFVRSRFQMSLGAFPAVNLSTGVQQFSIVSKSSYEGGVVVNIEYYQRWDQTPQQLDTIISSMDDDMERIKANLEDNPTLAGSGQAYAVSIPKFALSADKGEEDATFGFILLKRTLMATILTLPYDTNG